ncbi:hypothetical protein L1987_16222 [Smallanthus sonchifolius]|uniref:Uncharacterized protein n=1 Tax=Smallanthus sonchifolius TaxID=185202 RepID=A0ACB9J9V2_9ASTR|nr:hypothetical protein L1987_16222 [Smallanthus sonchifolius]
MSQAFVVIILIKAAYFQLKFHVLAEQKVRTCLKFSLLRTEVTNLSNPARATKANPMEIARNPAEKVTATTRATKGNPARATKANPVLSSNQISHLAFEGFLVQIRFQIDAFFHSLRLH